MRSVSERSGLPVLIDEAREDLFLGMVSEEMTWNLHHDYTTDTLLSPTFREWGVGFVDSFSVAGLCNFTMKRLEFSAAWLEVADEHSMRNVVRHEVAHVIAGAGHGHDKEWKRVARRIGAAPRATEVFGISRHIPWTGTCPVCGAQVQRASVPRAVVSCPECSGVFDTRFIYRWSFRGEPREPGGSYARQLAHLVA